MKEKIKILTFVGARPQFIKAATVSREIKKWPLIREVLVHSGQHYDHDMSDVFFSELNMQNPEYNLGIGSMSHGAGTGRMIEKSEEVIHKERPDGIFVYGDTNTTIAAALAAVKMHVPIFHVEAGLRIYDMHSPEEVNRRVVDHVSQVLFAPSRNAVTNLEAEGIVKNVFCVGDVMYDSVNFFKDSIKELGSAYFPGQRFILLTIHRQENTTNEEDLIKIFSALSKINIPVLFPLHPRTRKFLSNSNVKLPDKCKVINPIGYLDILREVCACAMVATDSGGLQKEAFFMGRRAIVLQDQSGWPELEECGANIVCGTRTEKILSAYERISEAPNPPEIYPYGNGTASKQICDRITKYFS
ncbi:MAG: UDP-N-acetylglucosamine 2-epimerase (non-hydrolyzing) [Alphaproteobacteria bacterium]|jgi:UDP-GlcNAc3NAcA epimerase|nr:UDP-N-acetylglucosamine 2-epimerase (non-hydrolyzing) [Alphaproteobacteria bacterium]